jgi:hypothetical protein
MVVFGASFRGKRLRGCIRSTSARAVAKTGQRPQPTRPLNHTTDQAWFLSERGQRQWVREENLICVVEPSSISEIVRPVQA